MLGISIANIKPEVVWLWLGVKVTHMYACACDLDNDVRFIYVERVTCVIQVIIWFVVI